MHLFVLLINIDWLICVLLSWRQFDIIAIFSNSTEQRIVNAPIVGHEWLKAWNHIEGEHTVKL